MANEKIVSVFEKIKRLFTEIRLNGCLYVWDKERRIWIEKYPKNINKSPPPGVEF